MFDGHPLQGAKVVFQPDEAKPPSYGTTDADGRFELMRRQGIVGAMMGQHTVQISIPSNSPRIPARYNTESELKREVKAGEDNEFDFELTSDKK